MDIKVELKQIVRYVENDVLIAAYKELLRRGDPDILEMIMISIMAHPTYSVKKNTK